MTTLNTPAIGDEVLDPNEKFDEVDGLTKYDQLLCDGSVVYEEAHPLYYATLEDSGFMEYLSFSAGSSSTYTGVCSSSTEGTMWVLLNGTLSLWSITGADLGMSYDIDAAVGESVRAVEWDGSNFWAVGSATLYQLTDVVTLTGVTHALDNSVFDTPVGITFDGTYLWVLSQFRANLGKIDRSTGYTGDVSFLIPSAVDGSLEAVSFDGLDLWVTYGNLVSFIRNAVDDTWGTEIAHTNNASGTSWIGNKFVGCATSGIVYISGDVRLRPPMNSGSDECPYRVVADKYTPSIGEVRPSMLEKYSENGIAMFDNLLCDGSEVLEVEHPVYYATADKVESYARNTETTGAELNAPLTASADDNEGASVLSDTALSYSEDGADLTGSAQITYAASNITLTGSISIIFSLKINGHATYISPIGLNGVAQGGWSTLRLNMYGTYTAVGVWRMDGLLITGSGGSAVETSVSLPYAYDTEIIHVMSYDADNSLLVYEAYSDSGVLLASDTTAVTGTPTLPSATNLQLGLMSGVSGGDLYKDVIVIPRVHTIDDVFSVIEKAYRPTNTSTYPDFPDHVIADLTEDV